MITTVAITDESWRIVSVWVQIILIVLLITRLVQIGLSSKEKSKKDKDSLPLGTNPRAISQREFLDRIIKFGGGQIFEYAGAFELCVQISGIIIDSDKPDYLRISSLWTAKRDNSGGWRPQFLYEGTNIRPMYRNDGRQIFLTTASFFVIDEGLLVIEAKGYVSIFVHKNATSALRPDQIQSWDIIAKNIAGQN